MLCDLGTWGPTIMYPVGIAVPAAALCFPVSRPYSVSTTLSIASVEHQESRVSANVPGQASTRLIRRLHPSSQERTVIPSRFWVDTTITQLPANPGFELTQSKRFRSHDCHNPTQQSLVEPCGANDKNCTIAKQTIDFDGNLLAALGAFSVVAQQS